MANRYLRRAHAAGSGAGACARRDPHQVGAGLSAAQVLPALAGAVLGIPGGIALLAAAGDTASNPPPWQLLAVLPGTLLVVAALTAIPARLGAQRPVAEILQAERA